MFGPWNKNTSCSGNICEEEVASQPGGEGGVINGHRILWDAYKLEGERKRTFLESNYPVSFAYSLFSSFLFFVF